MLEVLGEDYVRTARAKGLPERTVVLKHAVRNGLLPVLTLLAGLLPRVGGLTAALLAVAWAPGVIRAFVGWAQLSGTMPPLRRTGRRELFYGLWFTTFFAAGLHAMG